MDNKDTAEVKLMGCKGEGEGRAQMAASFVVWAMVPSPAIIMNCSAFCYKQGSPQDCGGCGATF